MTTKPNISHAYALELFNAKQYKQALAVYEALFTLNEQDAQAWHMASAIAGMSGDYTAARAYSERAISLSPKSHGPRLNLAMILQATGDLEGALQQYKLALQLNPADPQTLTGISNLYVTLGNFQLAENHLKEVIKGNPGYAEAYNSLGNVYRETSRIEAAATCYRQAISLRQDYVDALCNLGAVLSEQLQFEEAESCYSRALSIQPGNPDILHGIGNLYQSIGDFPSAKSIYQQAMTLNPSDIGIRSSLASLYERCGEQSSSVELLEPLIHSGHYNSDTAITYAKLCCKSGEYDYAIHALEQIVQTPQSPGKTIDIYFSLGELYDQAGNYDKAFEYYKKANDLDTDYSSNEDYSEFGKAIATFYNSQDWRDFPRSSNKSELPVFIVGMPRTGTSLVEQILASHPQVKPGGERGDIFKIIDSIKSDQGTNSHRISALKTLSPDLLNKLSSEYIAGIQRLSRGFMRFTDKAPLHGEILGFINQLLPKCRVIVCNREPLDACLSIYFHRFNAFHGYAKRLDTLGIFFREYQKLMRHWIDILDLEIFEIQYEQLVNNPERIIRELVDFCGLAWNDRCLSFHENRRTVNTPSYNQVRRPMYTDSIERWKHYAKHLEPLRAALTGS